MNYTYIHYLKYFYTYLRSMDGYIKVYKANNYAALPTFSRRSDTSWDMYKRKAFTACVTLLIFITILCVQSLLNCWQHNTKCNDFYRITFRIAYRTFFVCGNVKAELNVFPIYICIYLLCYYFYDYIHSSSYYQLSSRIFFRS